MSDLLSNSDFTIYLPSDKKMFWEHVGMLGTEDYDISWSKKMNIFENYFPNQLIKTYENGAISKDAQKLIDKLKEFAKQNLT